MSTVRDVGIALFLGFTGYTVFNYFKKKSNEETKGTDENQEKGLEQIEVNKNNLVRPEFNYKNVAEQIYNELNKRVPFINYWYYDSAKLFSYLQGLNNDELKQVAKEFGVRSTKLYNLIPMSDGGTIFEWFDNILTDAHNQEMRRIWAGTQLWTNPKPSAYSQYLKTWYDTSINKLNAADVYKMIGKDVYGMRTGNSNWDNWDAAWPNLDSHSMAAKDANGLKIGVYRIRPQDAIKPFGKIVAVGNDSNGKASMVMIEFTHPVLYRDGAISAMQGQRAWIRGNWLNLLPYSPPALKGFGDVPFYVQTPQIGMENITHYNHQLLSKLL